MKAARAPRRWWKEPVNFYKQMKIAAAGLVTILGILFLSACDEDSAGGDSDEVCTISSGADLFVTYHGGGASQLCVEAVEQDGGLWTLANTSDALQPVVCEGPLVDGDLEITVRASDPNDRAARSLCLVVEDRTDDSPPESSGTP